MINVDLKHMASLEPKALVTAFANAVVLAPKSRAFEEARELLAAEILRRLSA